MDLGTFVEIDGRPAIRFERVYQNPIADVWTSITDPDHLAGWFPSRVRFDPRPGGTIAFSGDPYADDTTGTVLVYDPPTRFAFTWLTDELRFELTSVEPDRTRLVMVNLLSAAEDAARNGAGWSVCLDLLSSVIEDPQAAVAHAESLRRPAHHEEAMEAWREYYDAYVEGGTPHGNDLQNQL